MCREWNRSEQACLSCKKEGSEECYREAPSKEGCMSPRNEDLAGPESEETLGGGDGVPVEDMCRGTECSQVETIQQSKGDEYGMLSLTFYASTSCLHVQGKSYLLWYEEYFPTLFGTAEQLFLQDPERWMSRARSKSYSNNVGQYIELYRSTSNGYETLRHDVHEAVVANLKSIESEPLAVTSTSDKEATREVFSFFFLYGKPYLFTACLLTYRGL